MAVGELGEIDEGIKQKNYTTTKKTLIDMDKGIVITRVIRGYGKVEEGKGVINGNIRRLDFGW